MKQKASLLGGLRADVAIQMNTGLFALKTQHAGLLRLKPRNDGIDKAIA